MVAPSPLKKISIFRGLGKAELALLEARASRQRFAAGSLVISEGDQSDSMFVILSGAVRVFSKGEDGSDITFDTMGARDYFGEYALLDGSKRSASVETTEDSDFLVLRRDDIIDMFADNPETAFSLIGDLVQRIRDLTSTVKNLKLMEIQGRVAGVILNLSNQEDQSLSADDVTSKVDAPHEVVEGIMSDLESSGYITRKDNQIILNPSRD